MSSTTVRIGGVRDNGATNAPRRNTPWNSNFLLTNLFLFHLQRHSDHHAYAKRRYQVLRHYDSSPHCPTATPDDRPRPVPTALAR